MEASGDSVLLTCQGVTGRDEAGREVGQIRADLESSTVPTVCQALFDVYKDERNQVRHWQKPTTECGVMGGGPHCGSGAVCKVAGGEGLMEEGPSAFASHRLAFQEQGFPLVSVHCQWFAVLCTCAPSFTNGRPGSLTEMVKSAKGVSWWAGRVAAF